MFINTDSRDFEDALADLIRAYRNAGTDVETIQSALETYQDVLREEEGE